MERFRKYIGRALNTENIRNSAGLEAIGIRCAYLSDPMEDFDEAEFRTGFGGRENIVITVATEMGQIKRVMFSEADAGNPDVIRSLAGPALERFLTARGGDLVRFFEYITR
ncbi:MAG: hypothetical protein K6T66_08890 [Peptococcaceae bacterium]|nr:hypothetical protein [Peptococcaceae bacterium]